MKLLEQEAVDVARLQALLSRIQSNSIRVYGARICRDIALLLALLSLDWTFQSNLKVSYLASSRRETEPIHSLHVLACLKLHKRFASFPQTMIDSTAWS